MDCDICGQNINDEFQHQVKGIGSLGPKVIFLTESPSLEETKSGTLKDSTNFKFFVNLCSDFYYTTLFKCPSVERAFDGGIQNIRVDFNKYWKITSKELSLYENVTLIAFGDKVYDFLKSKNFKTEDGISFKKVILTENINEVSKTDLKKLSEIRKTIYKEVGNTETQCIICNFDKSMEVISKIIERYKKGEITDVFYDLETTSLLPWQGDILMAAFADTSDPNAYCIPYNINNKILAKEPPFPVELVDFDISPKESLQLKSAVRELLHTVPVSGHNLKFDLKWEVVYNNLDLSKVRILQDTLIDALIIEGRVNEKGYFQSLKLKDLSRKHFDIKDDWDKNITKYQESLPKGTGKSFKHIPTSILGRYSALDVFYNRKLGLLYRGLMLDSMKNISKEVTFASTPFIEIETKGVKIDDKMKSFLESSYSSRVEDLDKYIRKLPIVKKLVKGRLPEALKENKKKRKPLAEEDIKYNIFNINSNNDMRSILYDPEYLNLPVNKEFKTKKGAPGASKHALNSIIENTTDNQVKAFLSHVLEYKRFSKLLSTYITPVENRTFGDSLYKAEFNLTGTVTGRLCFTGDTKISLLDGTETEIKDLVGRDEFWVYSCKPDGTVVPGRGHSARITKYVDKLVEVTLDNDEIIRCTPDHRFMLRDGSYKEAKDLTVEDSLMPLYREKYNRRIKKIKLVKEKTNVYDITVDEHSNFALSSGVFVHNSSGFHIIPSKSDIKRLYISRWQNQGGLILASDYCWKGDTKIRLANQEIISIKDLVGRKEFYVYSFNAKKGCIEIERGHSARLTLQVNTLVKITLNTGDVLECTDNHKLYLNSGEIVEARYLKVGDSLLSCAWGEVGKPTLHSNHRITNIEYINVSEDVYTLSVDNNCNYYLANGVLSKNSQLELRLAASLSGETSMIKAYSRGIDIHANTAADIYKKSLEDVSKEERSHGKTINFAILYQKIASSLAQDLGITTQKAQGFLDNFFNKRPFLKTWIEKQKNFASNTGFVTTPFGRILPTPNAKSSQKYIKAEGLRQAVNFPCQCYLGETEVELLSGKKTTMKKLSNIKDLSNKEVFVYSCKPDGTIVPGKVIDAFVSGKTCDLVTVTLDNDKTVTCTPEHPFMLRDGSYKEAQCLTRNDSLMPLYTGINGEITNTGNSFTLGYPIVKNNKTNTWIETHKLMCEGEGGQVHHKDRNIFNNNPWNTKNNRRINSVKHITLKNPVPVYDLTVETYHNFALSAGVFTHNSTASDTLLIANNRMYVEMKKELMQSLLIGAVHDSILHDIYPGELFKVIKLVKKHTEIDIRKEFSFLTCPLEMDVSLGTSWGGTIEFKVISLTDTSIVLEGSGLDKDFKLLKLVGSKGYSIEIEVLKEDKLPSNYFGVDDFVKSNFKQFCRVKFTL